MYRGLRDHDPVHHVSAGDYWVLSRFREVFDAARDAERFSSAQGLTFFYDDVATAGLDAVRPMVFLDPPEHTEFRRLVAQGFTPRQVAEIEPAVRAFAVERIEGLRSNGGGDIVADLLKPLPTFVVAHYLGVPEADRVRFDSWVHRVVAASATGDVLAASDTVAEIFEYFTALIERRRAEPGDDTISHLVQAGDGAGVDPLRFLGFAFTMITGGNDTTTGLLGVGLDLLHQAPGQQARLAADLTRVDDAVQELLRLSSPVQGLARTTTVDVDINGVIIPASRKVLLLYAAANRDPREFGDDADVVRIDRQAQQILTFSYGVHHCLGAAAARLMGRVVLEELLARCPRYAVDGARGTFAAGNFVRWYDSLPFLPEA
jgi:cytochrome P450 family 130